MITSELDPGRDPKILTAWLGLLIHSDLGQLPPAFAPVAALFDHEDPSVRTAAMRVAQLAPDAGLANILRDRGWRAADGKGEESFHGSIALARADPVEDDDRHQRVLKLTLGILSREAPDNERFAEAFAEHAKARIGHELQPTGTSRGYGYFVRDGDSYERLVAEQGDIAETWLDPALDGASIVYGHLMFSADKATLELCRALIDAERHKGAEALRALIAGIRQSDIRADEFGMLAFKARHNEVTEELRRENLAAANLDDHLSSIAAALQKRGEAAWLISIILELFAGSVLGRIKALVLAGELDNSPEADSFWKDLLLPVYLPPWLGGVRSSARETYLKNVKSKLWLARFCESHDPLEQFSAFELFTFSSGRTCVRWATDLVVAAEPRLSQRAHQHWLLNVPRLNERLKAGDSKTKDRLGYERVPRREQAPWRP